MKKSLTVNDMRRDILDYYPDATQDFRSRVPHMKPSQVIAIWNSIHRRKKKPTQKEEYHQMDIWEWEVMENEKNQGPGTHTPIIQSPL